MNISKGFHDPTKKSNDPHGVVTLRLKTTALFENFMTVSQPLL